MGRESVNDEKVLGDAAMEAAVQAVDDWAATSSEFTGRWINSREALIGVGIVDQADDEAIRESLQSVMPAGIRVRVRFVSAEWARLHQLQVHVAHYLEDENIWERYGTALGVDQFEQHVEVGLLPSTPDLVAASILEKFTADVVLDRNGSYTIAV